MPLRFHFANDRDLTRSWIADRNDPHRKDWLVERAKQQATDNYRDLAIVARFTDHNTGRPSEVGYPIWCCSPVRGNIRVAPAESIDPIRRPTLELAALCSPSDGQGY
jgi:hypothetical protein